MWKRVGQRSALDRSRALLSARRSSGGDVESVQGSTGTAAAGGSLKTKYSNTNPLLSSLSDLSSGSSAAEHGGDTMQGSAAPAGRSQARERLLTEDLRPERPLGGGGSRFLKKAPPAASSSSLSPVLKGQRQQAPGPRNVPSYQRGSQAAALSKLAQIERRIRKQVQGDARQGPKPAEDLTSDEEISPAARYLEAPVQHSVQSNSDQILRGSRFLKNKTPVTVNTLDAAAGARPPKGTDIGVRSRSRAADTVVPLAALETKPVRVASGVSLEGDEEDTRKLLGDTLDSINHLSMSKRPSSIRTADKIVPSSPPPAVVPPSSSLNTAPPGGAASPSCHSSPFRFPGEAQALFSPPVPSPPPSPPCVSSPPPGREGSPQRSLSSFSGRGEVLSLEELFLGDPQSETSAVTSGAGQQDFKINVMTLDDLGFTENTPGEEREESPNRHQEQQPQSKEKKDELQVEEEDAGLYQSDFDSEPDYSVSEHLRGAGGEPDLEHSNTSRRRTQDDYSSTVSGHSQPLTKSDDSRSSVSHDGRISSRQSRWPNSSRKVLKETAVQTQHDPLAYTWPAGALAPPVRMTYMDPTPVGAYTLSAEMVEALSTSNPAVFALNEMLKQQLAMTRRLMESRHRLHSSLVQSLGPANYRYTTLEDTKEYIRIHRRPKLKMEEALEELLQEMRDHRPM
uniref:uncharacterized protein C19orf44 homolog isoform X1 n=1 Tax=Gasterosteus aculeatus aculeatus TaxID=481459 RepID=UPI001A9956A1|nr:uncharacterized protein C19orf44 homolog isoform X1 [Gasterosteus aculeatus aculeatus]